MTAPARKSHNAEYGQISEAWPIGAPDYEFGGQEFESLLARH